MINIDNKELLLNHTEHCIKGVNTALEVAFKLKNSIKNGEKLKTITDQLVLALKDLDMARDLIAQIPINEKEQKTQGAKNV